MGKIAKGVNEIHFTMLYGNYCYIFIENFPQKFSPCSLATIFRHEIDDRICIIICIIIVCVQSWHRAHTRRRTRSLRRGNEKDTGSYAGSSWRTNSSTGRCRIRFRFLRVKFWKNTPYMEYKLAAAHARGRLENFVKFSLKYLTSRRCRVSWLSRKKDNIKCFVCSCYRYKKNGRIVHGWSSFIRAHAWFSNTCWVWVATAEKIHVANF